MRPQHPWMRKYSPPEGDLHGRYDIDNLDPAVRALFDASGPVRDRKSEG